MCNIVIVVLNKLVLSSHLLIDELTFHFSTQTLLAVVSYSGRGDVTSGGDITSMDLPGPLPSCPQPTAVKGTLIYKNGQLMDKDDSR